MFFSRKSVGRKVARIHKIYRRRSHVNVIYIFYYKETSIKFNYYYIVYTKIFILYLYFYLDMYIITHLLHNIAMNFH